MGCESSKTKVEAEPVQRVDYFTVPISALCSAEKALVSHGKTADPLFRKNYLEGIPILLQDAALGLRRKKKNHLTDNENAEQAAEWAESVRQSTTKVDLAHFVLTGDTTVTTQRYAALVRNYGMTQTEPIFPVTYLKEFQNAAAALEPLEEAVLLFERLKVEHPEGTKTSVLVVKAIPDAAMACFALSSFFGKALDATKEAAIMLRTAIKHIEAAEVLNLPLRSAEATPSGSMIWSRKPSTSSPQTMRVQSDLSRIVSEIQNRKHTDPAVHKETDAAGTECNLLGGDEEETDPVPYEP